MWALRGGERAAIWTGSVPDPPDRAPPQPTDSGDETAPNGVNRPREAPHHPGVAAAAAEDTVGLDDEQIAVEASLRSAAEERERRSATHASHTGDGAHAAWVPGMMLLVRDYFTSKRSGKRISRWRLAEIVDVDSTGDKVCVHFDGWSKRWDEWISPAAEPERFRVREPLPRPAPPSRPRSAAHARPPLPGGQPLDDSLPLAKRDTRFAEQMLSMCGRLLAPPPPRPGSDRRPYTAVSR